MVLGRTAELEYLNTYYDREKSQIMVVYGEQNIGKTLLLSKFVQDKPFYYYRARSASEREQRYQWGREIAGKETKSVEFPTFSEIFSSITRKYNGKIVIIIDEFQYIVKTSDHFMDELINFIHNNPAGPEIMIILCSSSIGWVENSMVARMGAAVYELSGFLKVKELDFRFMMDYFPGFGTEKCIEAYAVLGGVPGLWKHFDDKLSIKENICKNILKPSQYLYGEGQRIVEKELRETGVYNTILASIAADNHKLNDLYLHTEFSRAKISVYLKNLMELELVEKVFSYDTEGIVNAQKGIYRIKNHLVHFYFTFIYPNLSYLESMKPEEFYDRFIEPHFKSYVSAYYKAVCTQQMMQWSKAGRLPVEAEAFGEWVGKYGNIDIIVKGGNDENIIGLCSFEKPINHDDYEWLLFCAQKAKLHADYVYLFSVSQFDEKLRMEAKRNQSLKLITVEEM